eukprot:4101839-Pleurochrysis_carterae.AAC.1
MKDEGCVVVTTDASGKDGVGDTASGASPGTTRTRLGWYPRPGPRTRARRCGRARPRRQSAYRSAARRGLRRC